MQDEAQRAGRDAASFQAAADDYFQKMDAGIALSADSSRPAHLHNPEKAADVILAS